MSSYNTSVQLGQTAFLICKVAPEVESVSKLSYRIPHPEPVRLTPLPPPRPISCRLKQHQQQQMSQTNYMKFLISSVALEARGWRTKQLTSSSLSLRPGGFLSSSSTGHGWLSCANLFLQQHLNQSFRWKLMTSFIIPSLRLAPAEG